jgi:hypothetical protein
MSMTSGRDVVPGTLEAGGHAEQKFRELRAEYRRSIRKVTWPILAVAVTSSFVGYMRTDFVTYLLVLLGGGAFVLFLAWRDILPRHVEHWEEGAEGERKTAKQLSKLPPGWRVWHDLNGPRGNIDHLVVGRGGVFVLDTKNWTDRSVSFERGVPVSTSRHRPTSRFLDHRLAGAMLARSAAQSAPLAKALGRRVWVQAVVVLWADLEQPVTQVNRVTYVHGSELSGWLISQPQRLTDVEVQTLARAIGRSTTP